MEEKIDIQNIEELLGYEECTTRGDIIEKINELIKTVKQLDIDKISHKDILTNEKILGKIGMCSDCGKEGRYCYEPYYAEIHEEKFLICLCEDCKHERYENV